MHTIDARLHAGLHRMLNAYDGLLSLRQSPIDKLNVANTALDAEWQAELEPVLRDLYWYPFRNGIDQAPEDVDELRSWLRERYDDATAIAVLLLLLRRYQVRALNHGGQAGLEMLSIDGTFRLTNDDYLAQLDDHATMLVTQGSEMSLIDTTIDDLTEAVPTARKGEGSTLLVLGAYIAARAALRTVLIERSERPRQVANGLNWTFQNNSVRMQMYDINGVGCPKICAPLHGRTMRVDSIPFELRLPQHPGCDCVYTAILDGWNMPETVWTGG